MQLLLRVGVQSRISRVCKAGYRDCWHLIIDRAVNQLAFLTKVGVHGERGVKAQEVAAQLEKPDDALSKYLDELDRYGVPAHRRSSPLLATASSSCPPAAAPARIPTW